MHKPSPGDAPPAPLALPSGDLLEALPDAVVCVDDGRRILFRNAAARRWFGDDSHVDNSTAPGSTLAELLDQLKLPAASAAPSDGGVIRLVKTGHSSGQRRAWEVNSSEVVLEGRPAWLLSVREASHQQQIETALYHAQERQMIGALASGVAHDFNNVLAAIIANLDLVLLDHGLSAEMREFLTRAQTSARRGAELNSKLLSFSRHADTCPAPVDLVKIVEEALFILRRSVDKRIQIQFEPQPGAWNVEADQNQILQVLMNLCLNARDAMPEGGTLTIALTSVFFPASQASPPRRHGDFVRVTVSDTGVGMPPEVLGRILEPYFTTKEYGKGAGLGLSIACHVLAEHGGWLEVESRVGEGSRFHAFVPRSKPADARTPLRPLELAAMQTKAMEGTETILVVDDEASIRTVLRAMLQFRGYKVLEAEGGEAGLRRFQKAPGAVKLVLLDVDMPGLSGWETLTRLRNLDPRIPVLMLSGGHVPDLNEQLALLNASGLIEKPFGNQDLLRRVRETLDGVSSAPAPTSPQPQ